MRIYNVELTSETRNTILLFGNEILKIILGSYGVKNTQLIKLHLTSAFRLYHVSDWIGVALIVSGILGLFTKFAYIEKKLGYYGFLSLKLIHAVGICVAYVSSSAIIFYFEQHYENILNYDNCFNIGGATNGTCTCELTNTFSRARRFTYRDLNCAQLNDGLKTLVVSNCFIFLVGAVCSLVSALALTNTIEYKIAGNG